MNLKLKLAALYIISLTAVVACGTNIDKLNKQIKTPFQEGKTDVKSPGREAVKFEHDPS